MDIDDKFDDISIHSLWREFPIRTSQNTLQDPLESSRHLFRTLMTFLKSICMGFRSCNPPPPNDFNPKEWDECARITCNEELNIFKNLYAECIYGLRFFQSSKPLVISSALKQTFDITGPNLPITSSKEEKDLMEIFATMFIYIEPAAFNEIVQSQLEMTFEATLKNAALLHIPQFFLASEITTSNYSVVFHVRESIPNQQRRCDFASFEQNDFEVVRIHNNSTGANCLLLPYKNLI
ncbi:unnamed protein product [Ambrosiozyma monospora]|uniref:Unnamed protein product n=1 Tax=Ambrosiozyma monospora TaxID=43982 RepID=A0ACB5TN98_AMBMO|nr:unnamed protein product [Ambrosiozyma monospora]